MESESLINNGLEIISKKEEARRIRIPYQAGMTEAEYFRLLITQQPNDYLEIRSGLKDLVNDQREQTRLRWAKLRDVLLEV